MTRGLLCLALAASFSLTGSALAADVAYSEAEVHLARGLADRTNLLLAANDLAAEKSANPGIRAFAAKMSEQYAAALTAFSKQAAAVGIANIAPPRGAPGGGGPGPLPPEAQQQGAGGPGGPGGGGVNPKEKMIALVKGRISQFSGTQFDEVYLLTALQVTENIERQIMAEIMIPTSNPTLVAASKQYIQSFANNAIVMQEMLTRSGIDKVPEQPGKTDAEARSRLSTGDLFGISINN